MNPDIVVGQSISHFRILQLLGQGGMGVVYRAQDTALNRMVALKFILPGALNLPEERTRFLREAQAAAALNHPHIATVFEVGEYEGRTFIAMEYVDGQTLRDRIRSGPLALGEVVEMAVQLADGLEGAHDRGIIHRDIKTSNIMITGKNRVKLMDFGLARLSEVSQTLTIGIQGTVAYMSPEQASGELVDHRTDLWSLGVVFFEMLTGELPFQAAREQAVIHAILNKKPVPLTALRSDLPAAMEKIVGKCLEKNPKDRYGSAAELKADLVSFGRTVSPELAALTLTETIVRRPAASRLRRVGLVAGLTVAVLAAVLIVPPSRRAIMGWLGGAGPEKIVLAVPPFGLNGGQEADRASCDGLVDILTANLAKLQRSQASFRIIPAAEMRTVEKAGPSQLHATYKVNRVLSGTMNIRPARSMLTLALIDAANVKTIATEEIPVSTVDDDQLLDAVTERAVRWLGFELTPESIRALAGGASCLPETNPLYRQARGYLMRYEVVGNLIIAADQFKKVTEKDPRCAPAFAGWGAACLRLYQSTGQREYLNEGLKAAQQAIQLSRESPEVHITMGALLREMGQREEALKEFNEALRLDPQKAETHRELGTTYAALKDPAKAEKAYQMAITLDPNSWSGYSHLGVFYLFQGRYKEAAKNFKEVIALTPDNPRGLTNLATAYFYLYDLPSAIQTQERAVNLVPTPQACNNLGFYYYFSRRYVDAARMFERAVEKADRRTLYRGNLADAYRHIPGQEEKARPTYEKAIAMAREELSVSPNNTELLRFLARYYAQTGRPEDALAAIARAQDLSPQSPAVMESSVQVYEILGKRADALKALERLIRAKGSLQVVVLEPDLENLRQDSRYRAMMKSVEGVPSPK